MIGCVQDVVDKYDFLVQLKHVQKRFMGSFLLTHICPEEEVGHKENKTIYDILKNKVGC